MKQRFREIMENVQEVLGSLSAVQTLFGVDTAALAERKIHLFACNEDGTQNPSRIILDLDGGSLRWAGGQFAGSMYVLVLFEFVVPEASQSTDSAQALWMWEQVEDIVDEFEDSVRGGGEMSIESIEMVLQPGPVEPDSIPAEQTESIVWISQFRVEVST